LREGFALPPPDLAQAVRRDLSGPEYGLEEPAFWAKTDARVATPFYGFGHVELVTGHGDIVGGDYMRWLLAREPNALRLLGPENSLPHDYICPQAHRTALPEQLYHTAYIGERAAAFLREHKARSESPFFLMVSFPDPHHPFNPPGKYWDMYSPDDFAIPEAFQRNDWTPPPHVQAAIDARASGKANLKGMNTIGVTAREAQEARALTCGMISCVDDAVGEVLRALSDSPLRDNTVTIFTSDHGDHLGDHRLLLKGAEQYQSITRVPFIWSEPDGAAPSRTTLLGATLDIPATLLDRARIAPYAGMQGRSLLPAMGPQPQPVRDAVLIQYDHQLPNALTGEPPRIHTLIDGRWRISVGQHAAWGELYDLDNDPGEFDNLWESAPHAGEKARLMERLARAEIEHVDRVPLPTRQA
jgi:arylsulfatase A-like enzyme